MPAIELVNRYSMVKATGEESLRELGLDALDLECIRIAIEERHGLDLTDAEVSRWVNTSCIADTIKRLTA
jgi:hypothetical protein